MKALLGFGASSLASLALRALTLPLMSWLVAPPLIAQFALWQLALGLATLLAGQGLGHALQRDYQLLAADQQPLLMAHLFVIALGAGSLLGLIGWLLMPALIWWVLPLHVVLLWGIIYLRLRESTGDYALVEVGGRLLWLVLLVSVFVITDGGGLKQISHLLLLWVITEAVTSGWLLWLLRDVVCAAWLQRKQLFNVAWRSKLRQMLNYSRPVLLAEGLYWAMGTLGALLLTAWHGLESMAVYALAIAIGSVGGIAGQVFNTLWLPEVYRRHQQDQELCWLPNRARQIVWLALAFVALGTLASTSLWWLLPNHYEQLPWLVAATLLKPILMALQRVTAIGIELQRATWVSPLAMLLALLAQLAMAWLLIPGYGAAGAVVSLLVSVVVFWQLKSLVSARVWRSVGGWQLYLPVWLAVVMACLLAFKG